MAAQRLLVRAHDTAAGFLDCFCDLSRPGLIQPTFGWLQTLCARLGFPRPPTSWCALDHVSNPYSRGEVPPRSGSHIGCSTGIFADSLPEQVKECGVPTCTQGRNRMAPRLPARSEFSALGAPSSYEPTKQKRANCAALVYKNAFKRAFECVLPR